MRNSPGRPFPTACRLLRDLVLAVTLGGLLAAPVQAADDLPEMGSSANGALSRAQELQIGRGIYRSLVESERVMTDPEVQEYIQDVGSKLAAQAQDGGFTFSFFVVNDPAINAFALPGGFVGVHSGLFLATANESELAGVMAHEVSHVTQRHISRTVYANQRANILTMAALLGAILVGAVAGAGGDAIQGAVMSAQGAAMQQQIDFTRANEYEADRVGVGVSAAAGFDPMGMPSFFETLARQSGPLASQAPEFLRTHPVTVNRIAETRARAAAYPRHEVRDATGYGITKARIRVLTSPTPEAALDFFLGEQKNPAHVGDLGTAYGVALARLQLGQYRQAREEFQELLDGRPDVIPFHSGLAAAELGAGDSAAGLATYRKAMALFPRNVPLTVHYAEGLMRADRPREAHEVLLDLFNNVPPTAPQVRLIALAASAAGDTADAHYYMAEFHLLEGDPVMAADQLRVALSIPGLDSVQRARFTSRLEQVEEWIAKDQPRRARQSQSQQQGGGNRP